MLLFLKKEKTNAIFIIALLVASATLMSMPTKAQDLTQEGGTHGIVGGVGTTSSNIYGYPHLGPLPSGVTPFTTIYTLAYMSITPSPIGIGQQVLVNVWVSPGMPNWVYMQGLKVTIQAPDGTTQVIGPFNSYLGDATAWFQYRVDQVGTWRFKFESAGTYMPPGQYVPNPGTFPQQNPNITLGASIYFPDCSTDWQNLTAQQDMVASWPSVPLPTDYWTRPISIENREWYSIAGSYPWTGAYFYPNGRVLYSSNYKYTAYVQAPNTAHVVWRRLGSLSGLIGGEQYQYSAYSGGGSPSIIYAGRCYQTLTKPMLTLVNGTYRTLPTSVWECYDLRTGQVYWDLTDVVAPTAILNEEPIISTDIALGQANAGVSTSLVGISGGRLLKYSPYTGAVALNVSLPSYLTSSTIVNNEFVFSVQTINATTNNYRMINWTMRGSSTDFTSRIRSNITWIGVGPELSASTIFDFDAGIAVIAGRGLGPPQGLGAASQSSTSYASSFSLGWNITAIDLTTGTIYYNIAGNDTRIQNPTSYSNSVADRGKFATSTLGNQWVCRDAKTGAIIWRSDKAGYPWGEFWAYNTASYDFNESKGAIIGCAYDGIYAFDWDNGHIIWHYSAPMPPFESPYGGEPFFTGVQIADGKIYAYGGEHTPSQPITRGWHLHCINATTGELVWKITGAMTPGGIADGYLTASDPNDGYMYVFGKGQSATTISTPDTVVAKGTGVVIKGTVMDVSPGDQGSTQNPNARLDSPTAPGKVPCVSAASMETQMEYLYMQHPIDGLYHNETLTGVPVVLTAIGSDGSVIDIGTTTTNGYYGTFAMSWTPPKEDTYTITASFAGSDSYGSSSGATGLSVGPAPTVAPTSTPTTAASNLATTTDLMLYIVGGVIAMIVAIAIVGALILRKHA